MSFSKAFRTAIGRSVDVAKNSTAAILRMDVTPSAGSRGPLALWQITTPDEVADFATGSDKDLGGLSSVKLDLVQGSPGKTAIFEHKDESQHQATETTKATQTKYQPEPSHHGRFFGTLSNQVPRGAALERSGYAAFRNRVSGWPGDLNHDFILTDIPPTRRIDQHSSAHKHGTYHSIDT